MEKWIWLAHWFDIVLVKKGYSFKSCLAHGCLSLDKLVGQITFVVQITLLCWEYMLYHSIVPYSWGWTRPEIRDESIFQQLIYSRGYRIQKLQKLASIAPFVYIACDVTRASTMTPIFELLAWFSLKLWQITKNFNRKGHLMYQIIIWTGFKLWVKCLIGDPGKKDMSYPVFVWGGRARFVKRC